MFDNLPPIPEILAQILVLFLGIGLHEYAHCKFADMAGDPTPRYYGRVTLNLTKHFEPVGTLMMVMSTLAGFGIGWGRAAPCNPSKMRNPRWDHFMTVIAGPVSNLVQACLYAVALRLTLLTGLIAALPSEGVRSFVLALMIYGVAINCAIFVFNLIPFGPLDGHWLVGLLLPEKQRYAFFKFNQTIGMPGLFFTVIMLQMAHIPITRGPVSFLFGLLTGMHGVF